MSFQPTEAAFEGFRVVRRNPLSLVAWTLLYAVVSLTALFAMSGAVEPLIAWGEQAEALESMTSPTLADFVPLLNDLGLIMLRVIWLLPVGMVVGAMLNAAVIRAVLEPQNKGFGHLRLGMDEVRVVVVSLVLSVLMGLVCLAVFFVPAVLIAITASGGGTWGALVGVVAFIGGLVLLVWLAVRLSLALPITVAEKRLAFFDSFSMTKGRFWPLLGMAILALIMTLTIGLLSSIVTMPLAMLSGLQNTWTFGSGQDAEAMRAALNLSNPWVIGNAIVEAIINALVVAVLYAPFAAAYLGIKRQ